MKTTKISYEVYEDNGGELYLFILDEDSCPTEMFSGFEYQGKGALKIAIDDIANYEQWDNHFADVKDEKYPGKTLDDVYDELLNAQLIAWGSVTHVVVPERVGVAGSIAFGLDVFS